MNGQGQLTSQGLSSKRRLNFHVSEIDNGFMVSGYTGNEQVNVYAKDLDEAKETLIELFK